ncbi:MAG: hypothetical protein ACE5D3_05635 [Candidatus Binatia bacterium]
MSGTRQPIQGKQLSLAFETAARGAAPDAERRGAEPLAAKRDPESPAFERRLMEEICQRENFEAAWKRVRRNKGGPGVDGMTIADAVVYLREHWPTLRTQLLNGTYQPQPVKRSGSSAYLASWTD